MAEETITIGSVVIHTTDQSNWIWCTNSFVLYNERHRGADRELPGVAGVSGNPRVRDAAVFPLKLVIRGTSHDDLRSRIDQVRLAFSPITTGAGTRTVTWTRTDATSKTGECHVGPLEIGNNHGPLAVLATVDIQLDAGVWT